MSRSRTITDELWSNDPADWLDNPTAGDMLVSEFMAPLGLTNIDLAKLINVDAARLDAVIQGAAPMDGDLDLRLSRYFGMSEGFFMRLQNSYDLLEARRAMNGDLERIIPRAA